jgi:hypothetical protein
MQNIWSIFFLLTLHHSIEIWNSINNVYIFNSKFTENISNFYYRDQLINVVQVYNYLLFRQTQGTQIFPVGKILSFLMLYQRDIERISINIKIMRSDLI